MVKSEKLNSLYNSKNVEDLIKFYNNFSTREELIAWSKNRPKGRANIYTVNGKKDIVIVIPTIDRQSKCAKNCANSIFKGQQIVFVESGKDDPYFNYARNCNIGLKYALKYNPKWIVLSNDDMRKVDDFKILTKFISRLKSDVDLIVSKNTLFKIDRIKQLRKLFFTYEKLRSILTNDKNRDALFNIYKQFNVTLLPVQKADGWIKKLIQLMVYKRGSLPARDFLNFRDFGVFRAWFVKEGGGQFI